MKKQIVAVIAVLLSFTAFSQTGSNTDWNRDLDSLKRGLSAKHYDFFTVRSQEELHAGIEVLKRQSGTLSDFERAVKAQQLIATFGDSHTMLNFTSLLDGDRILPLGLLWVSDGLYVVQTTSDNEALLGHRVTRIGKAPIQTIVDSLSTLITVDNRAIVKSIMPQLIPSLQLLAHFGFADTQQAVVTLDDGTSHPLRPARMDRSERASFRPDSVSFGVGNNRVLFTERYFPEAKIYYMLYNSCWSRELEEQMRGPENAAAMPSFKEFTQRAMTTLAANRVEKIIFDMRNNGGGSSAQGTRFVEQLASWLREHPDVRVYVVIGRKTFSSAILNAMDFKRLTNAIFVGEETAGKPSHFGEVRSFQLPASGLRVNYSTKYFKRSDKPLSTIAPDVAIEAAFADYAAGIDPVFEWIKEQKAANRSKIGANK